MVLDGTLEVRDGDRIVNVLNASDAFGEMAFLLERPRAFDVDAAAKLLFNLSKMLCVRLIGAS